MRRRTTPWLFLMLTCGVTTACGEPEINVPQILSVVIQPPHGSVQISVALQSLVYFSEPVADPGTAATESINLDCLGTPPCSAPTAGGCPATTVATTAFQPGDQEARITPSEDLQQNTCYVITVTGGITAADDNVAPLPSDIRSVFQTAP